MNELQVFKYTNAEVRTVIIDGAAWWVAKDVCAVFGDTNYRRTIAKLDDDERGVSQIYTRGGIQNMAVVSESGLYAMLLQMQPTKARGVSDEYIAQRERELRLFRRFVTHEVLPAIRRTGGYIPVGAADSDADIMAKALAIANRISCSMSEAGGAGRVAP